MQTGTAILEDSLVAYYKVEHMYDLAITLLDIYSSELKTYVHSSWMFIVVSFIITKKMETTKMFFSVGEWINKLWHTQTVIY